MPHCYRVVVSDTAAARSLRDAGHEVILTPPGQSDEQLAETALCEDADAVLAIAGDGLGAALEARGAADVIVAADLDGLLSALVRRDQ